MADQETTADAPQAKPSTLSLARVLKIVIPIAVVLIGVYLYQTNKPAAAEKEFQSDQLSRLLGRTENTRSPLEGWVDADGDLLADAPAAEQCVTPERLVFCYVDEDAATVWQPFLDAVAERTGIATEYVVFTKDEQLDALASGKLHLTAINTGLVPSAVETAGFIPVCTNGSADGFGYTMDLLAKADSPIKKIEDLKGGDKQKKITFVTPTSNSGFKAAFLLLMNEYNMLPDRDYKFGFSTDHGLSVKELLDGKTDAVPVASDYFADMVASGEVKAEDVRAIYQSKPFPPIALGYAYNLAPEIRDAIKLSLLEFQWQGTPLVEAYGGSGADRFVPVDYKKDWAIIRDIDEQIEVARKAQ